MEIYIDIETLPGLVRPSPEDIEAPKNFKDPAKIRAYQEEKVEDAYRAQALDSMQGRILSIGWAIGDDPAQAMTVGLDAIEDEADLLRTFQELLLDHPIDLSRLDWVGHNIRSFDLPWIWRKSLKYRLHPLARIIPRAKFDKRIQDTLELWAADFRDRVSMDDIANFLGISGKTEGVDGSKVFDLWQAGYLQIINDYCAQDVEVTRNVHRIITGQPVLEMEEAV
jgi:hypothetical protein